MGHEEYTGWLWSADVLPRQHFVERTNMFTVHWCKALLPASHNTCMHASACMHAPICKARTGPRMSSSPCARYGPPLPPTSSRGPLDCSTRAGPAPMGLPPAVAGLGFAALPSWLGCPCCRESRL
eukprot:scaffold28412_cov17-Tisochrysis_lutea.AAC.2